MSAFASKTLKKILKKGTLTHFSSFILEYLMELHKDFQNETRKINKMP